MLALPYTPTMCELRIWDRKLGRRFNRPSSCAKKATHERSRGGGVPRQGPRDAEAAHPGRVGQRIGRVNNPLGFLPRCSGAEGRTGAGGSVAGYARGIQQPISGRRASDTSVSPELRHAGRQVSLVDPLNDLRVGEGQQLRGVVEVRGDHAALAVAVLVLFGFVIYFFSWLLSML